MNEPTPTTANVTTTDVLIIGAGPTGLTLACDLARRGVSFLLLERSTTPATASRAKTIQPRTMEVADDLGVAGRVLTEGRVNVPTRRYGHDQIISEAVELAGGVHTTDAPYPPVWLSQPRFEQILRERLTELGETISWGSEVTDLRQDDDGVTATIETTAGAGAGSRTVRARYAVGADGGRSTVRALAGMELHGTSLTDQRWHLGDVRVTGLSRHCQHLWTDKDDGLLSLFPLPGTDLWQFQASIPADQAEPEEPSLELFRSIFAERAGVPGVVIQDVAWLSLYRINVVLADHYRSGRILLAGDAAHIHSPAGGQGMNTGIQDAYNLGWKLAALLDGADPALLDTYEHERRPVARNVLDDSTTRLGNVMRAAGGESGGPSAQQGLTDERTTGLGIAYAHSPLTHGPGAGVRAPDAPCRNADAGRPTRLFDLLRGPQWTLLSFGSTAVQQTPNGPRTFRVTTDPTATGPDTVIDTDDLAHHAYQVTGDELILIRPDGYIAARRPANDLPAILALAATNGL